MGKPQTTVGVLPAEADRADALAEVLAASPAYSGVRISRSAVLRMAMLRGLAVIEQEHPGKPTRLARRRRRA
jgi:hypothetical protein